jgi:hypothetical protein
LEYNVIILICKWGGVVYTNIKIMRIILLVNTLAFVLDVVEAILPPSLHGNYKHMCSFLVI